MSTFTGRQQAGAGRARRTAKKVDAKVRQLRHEQVVVAYEVERGVTEGEARKAVRLIKHLEHQFAGTPYVVVGVAPVVPA